MEVKTMANDAKVKALNLPLLTTRMNKKLATAGTTVVSFKVMPSVKMVLKMRMRLILNLSQERIK